MNQTLIYTVKTNSATRPALGVEKGVDGGQYVARQVIAIAIGLVLFGIASQMPLSLWRQLSIPLLIFAGIATVMTLFLPINEEYPAHRWIRIGGFSFQSVELLKFALLFWLSGFLQLRMENGQLNDTKSTLQPLAIVFGVVGIVVASPWLQSDLGSAAVIAVMMVAMLFVAGVPIKPLMMIGLAILLVGTMFIMSSGYRRDRFATFMNPEADCSSTGYQACQAHIAVGSGGMTGLGLGNSVQAYGYVPEAENDSIFAIYAEKFGFIGAAVLLGLFLALYSRIKRIADRAPDEFSRLVVMGALVWLSTQALINVCAMIGLLPLKGITLPLISYGGSSVLMVLALIGVVFQVSYYTHLSSARASNVSGGGGAYDDSRNRRRFRGAYHAPLGSRS
jgi:cell division protein FtsW